MGSPDMHDTKLLALKYLIAEKDAVSVSSFCSFLERFGPLQMGSSTVEKVCHSVPRNYENNETLLFYLKICAGI